EIVPKSMIAFVAKKLYNEPYVSMPMKHVWEMASDCLTVEYAWQNQSWNTFKVIAGNESVDMMTGSEEEFITEHYWGYTKLSEEKTAEYAVEHPRWKIYPVKDYSIDVNFGELYGNDFSFLSQTKPLSVF